MDINQTLTKLLMNKYKKPPFSHSIHLIGRNHQAANWLRIFSKARSLNYDETIVRIAITSQCIHIYNKYDVRLGMYALCDPQQFDQFWIDLDEIIEQFNNDFIKSYKTSIDN